MKLLLKLQTYGAVLTGLLQNSLMDGKPQKASDMIYTSLLNVNNETYTSEKNVLNEVIVPGNKSKQNEFLLRNFLKSYLKTNVLTTINIDKIDFTHTNRSSGEMSRYLMRKIDSSTISIEELPVPNSDLLNLADEIINNGYNIMSWDPRIYRIDSFLMTDEKNNPVMVPFASQTAASAFYDLAFTIESTVAKATANAAKAPQSVDGGTGTEGSVSGAETSKDTYTSLFADMWADMANRASKLRNSTDRTKIPGGTGSDLKELLNDPGLHGFASLMNPYTITRLIGGIQGSFEDIAGGKVRNYMYDIRDLRRFYDAAALNGTVSKKAIGDDDFHSIISPTIDNIINWSNQDKWGRTPYFYQDFVYCKYYGIIPLNHMVTLRKYHAPTWDNLSWPLMYGDLQSSGKPLSLSLMTSSNQTTSFAPIASVVTFFGGDSGNSLSSLINFESGINWKEASADLWTVQGDTGTDPQAVIDKMFEGDAFTADNSVIKNLLSYANGGVGKALSFGKFLFAMNQGVNGMDLAAFDVVTSANGDPMYDGTFENNIKGPVNRIQSVLRREPGIKYTQSFSIKCSYKAKAIGNINPKAAILDILGNCMLMVSPEAVFWGGAHRFMIKPRIYPFHSTSRRGQFMDKLYQGKIFGEDGALKWMVQGLRNYATTDANGNLSEDFWTNIGSTMNRYIGEAMGGIGSMLSSVASTLFGGSDNILGNLLLTASDKVNNFGEDRSGTDAVNEGKKKAGNLLDSLNTMWKNKVIQNSVMPSLSNMRSVLVGEPVGNWHLTVGNPLNPILVCGNLICQSMKVEWGETLGPDDFPDEFSVTYTLEHGMARDRSAILSMFNQGAGRFYDLPDWVRSSDNYQTYVDNYTVPTDLGYSVPKFITGLKLMELTGARGYQAYKESEWLGKTATNSGNPDTTTITKFTPIDIANAIDYVGDYTKTFFNSGGQYATFKGNLITRKMTH